MNLSSKEYKVLKAYVKKYPNATVSDWNHYWKTLNECLDLESETIKNTKK